MRLAALMFLPLIPAKAGTQVLDRGRRRWGRGRSSVRTLIAAKAWVPAFAVMSGAVDELPSDRSAR